MVLGVLWGEAVMTCPSVCKDHEIMKDGRNNLFRLIIVMLIVVALISIAWDFIVNLTKLFYSLDRKIIASLVALSAAATVIAIYVWPEAIISQYRFANFTKSIGVYIRCKLCAKEDVTIDIRELMDLRSAIEKNRKREEEEAVAKILERGI